MSDNLPNQNNNPPNPNPGVINPPQSPPPPPQPPPAHPNPQNPPNIPNYPNIPNPSIPPNNTVDPVQSWIAQHEQRDSSGKFVKTDHRSDTPNSPNIPNSSNLPPLIKVDDGKEIKGKDEYPPMFQVANPVTYLKIFWNKVMKNEGIKIGFNFTVKPVTAVMIVLALTGTYATGYRVGLNDAAKVFFPNSSPILHREVNFQGIIQKSETGIYYLVDTGGALWKLIPKINTINLSDYVGRHVMLRGNLTKEKSLIEVKEIVAFENPVKTVPLPASGSGQPYQ